jgi:hypothetical protein
MQKRARIRPSTSALYFGDDLVEAEKAHIDIFET